MTADGLIPCRKLKRQEKRARGGAAAQMQAPVALCLLLRCVFCPRLRNDILLYSLTSMPLVASGSSSSMEVAWAVLQLFHEDLNRQLYTTGLYQTVPLVKRMSTQLSTSPLSALL